MIDTRAKFVDWVRDSEIDQVLDSFSDFDEPNSADFVPANFGEGKSSLYNQS